MMDVRMEAERYLQFGWLIYPVKHGTKKPNLRKGGLAKLKSHRPDLHTLRDWFDGRDDLGIGVWCGPESGGLTCRDYDQQAAYVRWRDSFPSLASTLPTVATYRGMHVYCLTDLDRIIPFPDGEIRANGNCILPPTIHPKGMPYRWVIPPSADIPRLSVESSGFASTAAHVTESTESTEAIVLSLPPGLPASQESSSSAPSEHDHACRNAIGRAVFSTLPKGAGYRNCLVFELARGLKAVPQLADAKARDLREYVELWHRLALPFISTKPFGETWADFVRAWPRVKYPKGDATPMDALLERAVTSDLPDFADRYGSDGIKLLIGLCRELQRAAGRDPFYLACRTAGRLLGVDHMTANRWLLLLQLDGVLELVKRGDKFNAARYRYLKAL